MNAEHLLLLFLLVAVLLSKNRQDLKTKLDEIGKDYDEEDIDQNLEYQARVEETKKEFNQFALYFISLLVLVFLFFAARGIYLKM